jgi:two-component system, OmpR family, sensor kinase
MSIRLRITLFGLGVVSAVLAFFCLAVFLLLAAGAGKGQDTALADRANQAVAALSTAPLAPSPSAGSVVPGAADPRVSNDVFVMVLDPTGTVLASTGGVDGVAPRIPPALLATVDRTGSTNATVDAAPGVPIRVYVRSWDHGYVAAAQTVRRVQNDRRGVFALLVIYAVLGFLAAAGAIWLVTGQALRPLRQLTGLVEEIGRSQDLSRRLPPVSTKDDVGRLTRGFNAMMDRVQEAYRRVAGALAAQQRFTGDASHELRTPLTTIRNNAGFLLHHADAASEDREAAVRDIAGESERMSRLVDHLLTLARADAGLRLELVPVDLGELAEDVCRQARTLHPDRDIHNAVTPTPHVAGDRDALAQLLWILVDNAVKFTAPGGNVWVAVTQRGDRAQLHVDDDGVGIPPGDERRVFARFYRADAVRSGGGAGLGLSIASWIVTAHGGTILAANNARGGASFVAELPTVPAKA